MKHLTLTLILLLATLPVSAAGLRFTGEGAVAAAPLVLSGGSVELVVEGVAAQQITAICPAGILARLCEHLELLDIVTAEGPFPALDADAQSFVIETLVVSVQGGPGPGDGPGGDPGDGDSGDEPPAGDAEPPPPPLNDGR